MLSIEDHEAPLEHHEEPEHETAFASGYIIDWDELDEAERIGTKHKNMKARTYEVEVSL